MLRFTIALSWLWLVSAHAGETVYITDKIHIAMRVEAAKDSAVVKTFASGAALEVLQRGEAFSQVQDATGAQGWIENRYLVPEPPAATQIPKIQAELLQAQTALAQEVARAAQTPAPPMTVPTAATPPADDTPTYLLLALSFAMLILGFFGGMWWLRERYRRRLGGMYLRI